MRERPTALCWYDVGLTAAPAVRCAEMLCLADDLGFDVEMGPHTSTIPFPEVVREADVDVLIVPSPSHLDARTLEAVRRVCDVETVSPRLTYHRRGLTLGRTL